MKVRHVLCAAVMSAGLASAASAGTYFFESFETPVIATGYQNYVNGSTIVGDAATWNVTGTGGVDIIRDAFAPLPFPDGHQAIDLNGWQLGQISTSIPTSILPAGSYTMTFELAANTNVSVAIADAMAGQASGVFTGSSSGWSLQTLNFTTLGSTTVTFTAQSPAGASGPTLDAVRIADPVPLPSAALGGLSLLGALGVMRARRHLMA